ncbi:hypothetical protein PV10_00946 [Exophiala mesophila]|uniref:Uncharacterized protein n=1 Tax=Exophiala mesophila TaxID=212818 RepID=A0A0D1ZTB2_EXOME|nr:uncharacterized protein PV10_00946 [Exophiala mesophila]KIV97164.1 hypothetical protein PV10_00946 [Exophiala mesophila]
MQWFCCRVVVIGQEIDQSVACVCSLDRTYMHIYVIYAPRFDLNCTTFVQERERDHFNRARNRASEDSWKNQANPNPDRPTTIWHYAELELPNVQNTNTLLVRVIIAKVENLQRLLTILRGIPVIQNDPNWRCHSWCANALAAIAADGTAVGRDLDIGLAADRTSLRGTM